MATTLAAGLARRALAAKAYAPALVHARNVAGVGEDKRIQVTMIPGDGVGPELMDSVQEVSSLMTLISLLITFN